MNAVDPIPPTLAERAEIIGLKHVREPYRTGQLSEVARHVKEVFDAKYGPTWHCIVGNDFRAVVTHESKTFIFFYVGKNAIMLYKVG